MANQETQMLDNIIDTSRRKLLTLGAVSIAGLAAASRFTSPQAVQAAAYSDLDILNFALNLEYLEANFYYLAAFGCTIDKPNAAAIAAGAPSAGITITGPVGTPGTVTSTGATQVPFTTVQAGSYATETAIEEGKHVTILQTAIGSSSYVAQPAINLGIGAGNAWATLGTAALGASGAAFNPYSSDNNFLLGAFVFEDVGVTAYHGAASLLTGTTTTLPAATGILAVEAYHAGLIRTSITLIDSANGNTALTATTTSIANLRASLALNALNGTSGGTYDANPDDYGVATFSLPAGIGGGAAGSTATRIVDADPVLVTAFARNTTQVLNIVTGGGKVSGTAPNATVNATATGVFYPSGMNAGPNGFK